MSSHQPEISRTLSIIKPDAVRKNVIGKILTCLEENGLKIVAAKMIQLTKSEAEKFYAVHQHKPFFASLTDFMSSGPIIVQVLEGADAVATNRKIMGSTDPALAAPGTIRKAFATSIDHNAVHGSDSAENAQVEIAFFFAATEIYASTQN